MRSMFVVNAILVAALNGCGGEDDTPPPPTAAVASAPGLAPTGQTLVTVVANSSPPGASVTGGGRPLGVTPLTTRVPVPAPALGEVQSFSFQFELAGHQTATIDASPVNGAISITAALAPDRAPEQDEDEADPGELAIVGRGGGPIYDDHVTRGSADVDADCTIDRLRVRLAGTHTYYADLHITLRDPDGNRYSLHRGARSNPFRGHVVRRAQGRQARGRWTLAVHDRLAQDGGQLRGWSMSLRCR